VVATFGICLDTLKRWLKCRKEGGDLSPRPSTGRKRRILSTNEEKRALWVQLQATTTPRLRATLIDKRC
jgi:transposase